LPEPVNGYSFIVNIIDINNDLKEDIIRNLATNKHLKKVYNHLVERLREPLAETTNRVKIILLNYYINKRTKLIYLRTSENIYA